MALVCWLSAPGDESARGLKSQIHLAISRGQEVQHRYAELGGGRGWVLTGAAEMGLDSLRRVLAGLPLSETTDFEKR